MSSKLKFLTLVIVVVVTAWVGKQIFISDEDNVREKKVYKKEQSHSASVKEIEATDEDMDQEKNEEVVESEKGTEKIEDEGSRPLIQQEDLKQTIASLNSDSKKCDKVFEKLQEEKLINDDFKIEKPESMSKILNTLKNGGCTSNSGIGLEKLLLDHKIDEKEFGWVRDELENIKMGESLFSKYNLIKSLINKANENEQEASSDVKKSLFEVVNNEIKNSSNLLNLMMSVEYLTDMSKKNVIPEEYQDTITNLKEDVEETLNHFKEEITAGKNINFNEKIDYETFDSVLLKELRLNRAMKKKILEVTQEISNQH